MPAHDDFEGALAAARAGGEWGWRVLYAEFSPVVLAYLRSQSAADAEDLTGEVFVQVVRDLARFEGGERDFRAWVVRIAHNRLVDSRRYVSRRPVDPVPDEVLEAESPAGDVAEEALAGLSSARVVALLGELSPDQRSVLMLRLLGGFTVEEVATVVGKRPGAVKALQRRGLAALRKRLEEEG